MNRDVPQEVVQVLLDHSSSDSIIPLVT
ncbi:hypothetical protein ACQP1W_31260 [Spirillospora sp. CA-255316]